MDERLTKLAARLAGAGESPPAPCPDPIGLAAIRTWTQAIGDTTPEYLDPVAGVAPPAMIQVWSMPGQGVVHGRGAADELLRLLDEEGYTGIVATDCEQSYDRPLRHGEHLSSASRFAGIAGPKRTALGEGYFVTWYQTWYDETGERVGEMLFRVLKFRPRPPAPPTGQVPHPATSRDTEFFWAGTAAGELRIQRCAGCGALRHPPGPMCPRCHSTERGYTVASGRGSVHSHVVHHHPPVPGRTPPYVVALVDLDEGVRMVGNVVGCPPEEVTVGLPVRAVFERVDDDLVLAQWTPVDALEPEPAAEEPVPPDALAIELTPTFVIAAALATRDFMPVHHDPAAARAQGGKDVFLNILTTMGLVQRYVTGLLPGAAIAGISIRLGAPAYAGDTLTLTGRRTGEHTVEVRGAVSLGDHVTATVRLAEGNR
ncbi:hypothetical protein DPM19_20675 [Actinomadura craniellae]|uniref:Protein dehydratase n=1 Tax=Actinomadura craniellae TaxID=2231787 RepID=A0A365H3C4_9ACTN|nr:hypothetical protein DPM19_20675 [Actinomadura craniellae]